MVLEEHTAIAGILAENRVNRGQCFDGPQRQIFEVADWGGNQHKGGRCRPVGTGEGGLLLWLV